MLAQTLRKALAIVTIAPLVAAGVLEYPSVFAADAVPIGRLATSGRVSIGNSSAPTGTVIFDGDHLSAREAPALVSFRDGSSVSLARGAAATVLRQGTTLLVRAEKGTIAFLFQPRQEIRMEAGRYRFTPSASRTSRGEVSIGPDGQVTVALSKGAFSALDTATGRPFDVSATNQAAPQFAPTGNGTLVNDTNTFSDPKQRWKVDSLKDKCIIARGEAHRIIANKPNVLVISGTWLLFSGTYDYLITECTAEALDKAGAAIGVDEALQPVTAAAASAAAAGAKVGGMSAAAKAGIIAAVAGGGAGAAIAVSSSRGSKSP